MWIYHRVMCPNKADLDQTEESDHPDQTEESDLLLHCLHRVCLFEILGSIW